MMPLQNDLLELAALDRRVVQAIIESNWENLETALSTYQALRRNIRSRLLDETAISITNPDAVALLQKITTGEGLPTDKVINHLHSSSEAEEAPLEFSEGELEALGSELFYSWFSHYEYISGLAELRPLALGGSVSESVNRLVRQVKNCYAFQQYDAAYGLCRTVVEASVRDICVRCQLFPDLGENVVLFENWKWSQLRDKVSSGPLRERLRRLYSDLCTVLHARKTVAKYEARRAFEETLQVVEQLYDAHGL